MAHLPYYNSKAHEIPSVTQIISLLNKKGLMDWSNWLGLQRIKYWEHSSIIKSSVIYVRRTTLHILIINWKEKLMCDLITTYSGNVIVT